MALDFLAGFLGGCAGVIVGHPLDTVKVHLQTQNGRNPMYRGTFHCIRSIIAKDSVHGLYRGITSPLAGVAFINAIVFGVYGNVQRHTTDPNSLRSHLIAGSAAGLVQSLVCSPMELVKTRLQLQEMYKEQNVKMSRKFMYTGVFDGLKIILKSEGIRGLFRGLTVTTARDVPGFGSYFIAYEFLTRNYENASNLHILLAGGCAGMFSWILTFPIDVVKSRIQADGVMVRNGQQPKYSGVIDCIQKSYRNEGLQFFTRGLAATIYRAFPTNAACFFVVSSVMKIADKMPFSVASEDSTESIHIKIPVISNVDLHFQRLSDKEFIFPPEKDINVGITLRKERGSESGEEHHHHRPERRNLNNKQNNYRKLNEIKNLLFFSTFSEAVCKSEIIELIHDDDDDDDYEEILNYAYYCFDDKKYFELLGFD